jgi:cyanophycinase
MKKTLIICCSVILGLFALPQEIMAGNKPNGKLFIIGGGSRPDAMVNRMIDEASLRSKGYMVILPMASEEPDSAIIWSGEQFIRNGITSITGFVFKKSETPRPEWLDSLRHASLIYISGGDQSRFMDIVRGNPIADAIHQAYQNGAVIAGTSAGAAVMSQKMITGDERRHPKYHETFRTIEADNIEFTEGLGLIKTAVIDQHFVYRSRHNRLITAVLEHPEIPGIGIDESTALLIAGNMAEVIGDSQVLVFRNRDKKKRQSGIKLGAQSIKLDIFLPGDRFRLK